MDYYSSEIEGKKIHDTRLIKTAAMNRVWVPEPVIIGAGPAGLATAACLKQRGVPSLVIERANCIASLWKNKTYDRLKLHLPKRYCELPHLPFPTDFPNYPSKRQFLTYLEMYANHFDINPVFNQTVVSAEFDPSLRAWRVRTRDPNHEEETEYVTKRLIVATGENAEEVVPEIEGMDEFEGTVLHTSEYRNGEIFCGKKVLVVGCGNSGMEISLDLSNYNACPSLVVRDKVHILPHEFMGISTFGMSMWLLKWFPIWLVDQFLLLLCYIFLSDTAKYGLVRPKVGPLQLKSACGKTPVLDVGTFEKIRTGDIKVCNGIKRLTREGVEFVDGKIERFDAIVLATGFKSNVPSWLKEYEMFSEEGFPKKPFPNGWMGEHGLYAAGFTKRGLLGASTDAKKIAEDIEEKCKVETKHYKQPERR